MADTKYYVYPSTVKQNTVSFAVRYSWKANLAAAARQESYVERNILCAHIHINIMCNNY